MVSPGQTATMGGPMAGYAVAHLDEIEEFADAGCHYRPIRRDCAKDDSDLDAIRDEPAFSQLISS